MITIQKPITPNTSASLGIFSWASLIRASMSTENSLKTISDTKSWPEKIRYNKSHSHNAGFFSGPNLILVGIITAVIISAIAK